MSETGSKPYLAEEALYLHKSQDRCVRLRKRESFERPFISFEMTNETPSGLGLVSTLPVWKIHAAAKDASRQWTA